MGRNNAEFSTGQVHGDAVTPEQLRAQVTGLLKSTHPVFGRKGSFDKPHNLVGEPDFWDEDRDYPFRRNPMNSLRDYHHPGIAAGDCYEVAKLTLPHLPAGSRLIHVSSDEGFGGDDDHFAVESPTTEGPHIVDLTHRQFATVYNHPQSKKYGQGKVSDIPFPLVEAKNEYLNRDTIKEGFSGRQLVERTPEETRHYVNG